MNRFGTGKIYQLQRTVAESTPEVDISEPSAEISAATRRTQDSDGNEKTARKGGKMSAEQYSYQGKSMTENSEIYSYDFLTHQPDMKVAELPALDKVKTDGKIDKEKTALCGIENAKEIGTRLSDTVASVTNRYTGREILISKRALLHGLYGDSVSRLRTNARISALAGEVIASAIPINALNNENNQALGTYAMVSIATAGEGKTVAIITTIEQHTNKLLGMESIDIAHALSGRIVKKEGSESSARERGYANSALPTITTFKASIADVLRIVNTTHQSILSENVLKALGETRNPEGYYAPRVKFSTKQQLDDAYMMAVRTGDTEKAQEMVETAAKKAGYTIHAYHGTARADRVGTEFREDRATSGPMAFFTDSRKIAENYAKDKADTSLAYDEEYDDYYTQFRVTRNGKSLAIGDLWNYLTVAERMKIKNAAPHIRFDDDYDQILYDPKAQHGNGAYDAYELNRNRGNVLNTLISTWLETGDLYDREGDFLDVLKLAGLNNVEYRDPNARHEKVYDVFLRIKNPFDASNAGKPFYDGLSEWLENTDISEYRKESAGADMWDKNSIEPERFLERLADDIEAGTSHVWTSIPDYVTAYLKKLGYDGIKDTGGKGGGEEHTVWIPFTGAQVKSAETEVYSDDGDLIPLSQRFKPQKRDIRFSIDKPEGFAEAIARWDADGREKRDFILGSTGEVLQGLGAIESDVYMRSEKIETILKQHPEMSLEEIKKIPNVLNDPVLVLKSRQSDSKRGNSRVVVFGSMKNTKGAPMLSVLDLRPVEGNLLIEDMQKVVSAYVKTGNPEGFLKNSEAMFVDKKRAARLLRSTGLQLRPGSLPPSGYIGSITYRGKNVNITGKQFSEFLLENKEAGNDKLTTIRNLNEDDLEALYGAARIPVKELLADTEGEGEVSLIVKNEDARNNKAHLEHMAAKLSWRDAAKENVLFALNLKPSKQFRCPQTVGNKGKALQTQCLQGLV